MAILQSISDLRSWAGDAWKNASDEDLVAMYAKQAKLPVSEVADKLRFAPGEGGVAAKRTTASVSNYVGGLQGVGEAVSGALGFKGAEEYLAGKRRANEVQAQIASERAKNMGAVESYKEVDTVGKGLNYLGGLAIQSAPYAVEAITGGLEARALMGGTRAALSEARAALVAAEATKNTTEVARATQAVKQAERSLNIGSEIGVAAQSYPSAVGDILQNQREQTGGKTDLGAAFGLGVPYAALNVLGVESALGRGSLFRNTINILDRPGGITGGLARAGATAVGTGVKEGLSETGQEMLNQAGRMAVDDKAQFFDQEARDRYMESFVGGAALGGAMGGALGGYRRSEGYQPETNTQQPGNDVQQAFTQPQTSGTPITGQTPPAAPGTTVTAPPTTPNAPAGGAAVVPGQTAATDQTGAPAAPARTQAETDAINAINQTGAPITPPSAPAVVGGTTAVAQASQQQTQADFAAQQQQQIQDQREKVIDQFGLRGANPSVGQFFNRPIFGPTINQVADALGPIAAKLDQEDAAVMNAILQADAGLDKDITDPEKKNKIVKFDFDANKPAKSVQKGVEAVMAVASKFQIGHVASVAEAAEILNTLSKSAKGTNLVHINAIHEALTGKDTEGYIASQAPKPTKGKSNVRQQQQLQTTPGMGAVPEQGGTVQGDGGLTGLLQPGAVQPIGTGSDVGTAISQQAGQPSGEGVRPSASIAADNGSVVLTPQVTGVPSETGTAIQNTVGGGQTSGQSIQANQSDVDRPVVQRRKRRAIIGAQQYAPGLQYYASDLSHISSPRRIEIIQQLLLSVLAPARDNTTPAETRAEIVRLALIEQFPMKEIAELTGIKLDTVSKQLQRMGVALKDGEFQVVRPLFAEKLVAQAEAFRSPEFPDGIGAEELKGLYATRYEGTEKPTGNLAEELEAGEQEGDRSKLLAEERFGGETGEGQSMGTIGSAGGSQGAVESDESTALDKIEKLQKQLDAAPDTDVAGKENLAKQLAAAWELYAKEQKDRAKTGETKVRYKEEKATELGETEGEEDAVQVESADEGDVQEPAGGGEEVGKANAEPKKPARARKAKAESKPAEEAKPEIKTAEEQWTALADQFPQMPPYATLNKDEKIRWDDVAERGVANLAAANTILSTVVKAAPAKKVEAPAAAGTTEAVEPITQAAVDAHVEQTVDEVVAENPEATQINPEQQAILEEPVAALPEAQVQRLENHYGVKRGTSDFFTKLQNDVTNYATKGAQAVAAAIRDIIKAVHAGVLAVAMVFNPSVMTQNSEVIVVTPKIVSETTQVKATIPAAAKVNMSAAAQEAYQTLYPAIKDRLVAENKFMVITDKPNARLFIFNPDGSLFLQKKVLVGRSVGDFYKGNTDKVENRITPAGLFTMGLRDATRSENEKRTAGEYDFGKVFVLDKAIDGEYSVTLFHSVWTNETDAQQRLAALKKEGAADSRYSFGCINVDKATFGSLVANNLKQMDGAALFIVPDKQELIGEFLTGDVAKNKSGKDELTRTQFTPKTVTTTRTDVQKNAQAIASGRNIVGKEEKLQFGVNSEIHTEAPYLKADGHVLHLMINDKVAKTFELVSQGLWNAFKGKPDAQENLLRNKDAREISGLAQTELSRAEHKHREFAPLSRQEQGAIKAINENNQDDLFLYEEGAKNMVVRQSIATLIFQAVQENGKPLPKSTLTDLVANGNARGVSTILKYAPASMLEGVTIPKFGVTRAVKNPYTAAKLIADIKNFIRADILGNKLTVVDSVNDLLNSPDPAVKAVGKALADKGAYGVATNGKAYLVADRIEQGQGRAKFMHEVGAHLGLENLLPKVVYDKLASQIDTWAKADNGSVESKLAKAAQARVEAAQTSEEDRQSEMLAYFIEEAVQSGIDPTMAGKESAKLAAWFRTMWNAIKATLRSLGFKTEVVTAQDIVDLAFGAAQLELSSKTATGQERAKFGFAGIKGVQTRGMTDKQVSNLTTAKLMDANGDLRSDIWYDTGWLRGVDNQWRTEFSDKDAKMVFDKVAPGGKVKMNTQYRLGDILSHLPLYRLYPEIADYPILFDPNLPPGHAAFDPDSKVIWMSGQQPDDVGVLLHEVQHAIQEIEGFGRGGSVENMDVYNVNAAEKFYMASPLFTGTDAQQVAIFKYYSAVEALHAAQTAYDNVNTAYYTTVEKLPAVTVLTKAREKREKSAKVASSARFQATQAFDDMLKVLNTTKKAIQENMYMLISGEVEARDVEARREYNNELRRQVVPGERDGINRDMQLVFDKSTGKYMSIGKTADEHAREQISKLPPKWQPAARTVTTTLMHTLKKAGLASMITEDVIGAATKYMKSAQNYLTAQYARQATRLAHELKIEKILQQHDKLPENLKGTGKGSVNEYIHDSTREGLWGYYPDARMVGTTMAKIDPGFKARFDAFPAAAQKLIKDVFEQGHDSLVAKQKAVTDAINREYADRASDVLGDADLTAELNKEKNLRIARESKLMGLDGSKPYAYMGRYGDYVVVAKSAEYKHHEEQAKAGPMVKGEYVYGSESQKWLEDNRSNPAHYVVQFAETLDEADQIAEQLNATGNYDIAESFEKEPYSQEGGEMFAAVARLRNLYERESDGDNPAAAKAIRNLLGDLYLHTVSEASARKSEFQRLNISGSDKDMMRNLATRGRADAHFLAALQHNDAISDAITGMREERNRNRREATPYFNELLKRHANSMKYETPGVLSSALLRMSTVWYLSTNPAFYLQQILQTGTLSLPYMAGRLGYFRSARAIKLAYSDMATLVKGLGVSDHVDFEKAPADVRAMLNTLVGMGKIDIGIDSDSAARAGDTGVVAAVMQKLQGVNNRIETINRATAAIAAYRGYLDRYKNNDTAAATKYAAEVVSNTHGSYDAFNTPRIMSTGAGKVLLQFKRFQIIQISMLAKLLTTAFKGASAEEKTVARHSLAFIAGQMGVLGGVMAVPFAQQAASILAGILGDPDEPDNWEFKLRRMIDDKAVADLLISGVPGAMGVDLSSKIGLGNVFSVLPFTDIDFTSRAGAEKVIVGLMGPTASLGLKFIDGLGMMSQGNYYKGLEQMLPNGVANVLKSGRFATEGITMRNGDVVLKPEEISMLDAAFQAVGLPTNTITDRQFTQRVVKEFDQYYKQRDTEIKGDYVEASRKGDSAAMGDAIDEWNKLQASRVANGYKRQPYSDLYKAPMAAIKRERNVSGGVEFGKSNRQLIESLSTI